MNAMHPTWGIYVMSVVLSGGIGYNYVYAPSQKQVRLIQTQIAQEQQYQRAQADVASLLAQVDRYRKRLPEAPEPSWIVRELVTLAQQTGIQLTSITQETPQSATQQWTRLAVAVQFTASYHQLGAFIDAIERSQRFLRIERLTIARAESTGSQLRAPIQLTLSTMYLPPLTKERSPTPVAAHAPVLSGSMGGD